MLELVITTQRSVIGGGFTHTAGNGSIVGAGVSNHAENFSIIGAGYNNDATGSGSMVGAGNQNEASGEYSFVGGGNANFARGARSIALGGEFTAANGDYSMVFGRFIGLSATASGSVYLADGIDRNTTRNIQTAPNTFFGRFDNGYSFFTDSTLNVGVTIGNGQTAWSSLSDRNSKRDFEPVDTVSVLEKVAELPMTTWHYKHDPETRHMGVMSQDLYKSFGLGASDKRIDTLNADGVQMAAIQGLHSRQQALQKKNEVLEERILKLEKLLQKASE